MAELEISQSESLLLGFCLDKYRSGEATLFDAIERHVRPFVPLLSRTVFSCLGTADLPSGIDWYALRKVAPNNQSLQSKNASEVQRRLATLLEKLRRRQYEGFLVPVEDPGTEPELFSIGRTNKKTRTVYVANLGMKPQVLPGVPASSKPENDDAILQVSWDTSRRSLVELLLNEIGLVDHHAERSLLERQAIPRHERWLWDFADHADEHWNWASEAPNELTTQVEGALPWWIVLDDEGERFMSLTDLLNHVEPAGWEAGVVIKRLVNLVGNGDQSSVLELGAEMSKLGSACSWYESVLHELQQSLDDEDQYLSEQRLELADNAYATVIRRVKAILSLPKIQRFAHAQSVLSNELAKLEDLGPPSYLFDAHFQLPAWSGNDVDWRVAQSEYASEWTGAASAAGLAFGDALATLRELDRAIAAAVHPLPTLRQYQLANRSDVGRVRAAIELAERELRSERTPSQQPEIVAACLVHGIEALSRRLWPDAFPPHHESRVSLPDVLITKTRDQDCCAMERRFASIALSLYKSYRNPVVHDLEEFRCTWSEAILIVAGLKVLLEIVERFPAA